MEVIGNYKALVVLATLFMAGPLIRGAEPAVLEHLVPHARLDLLDQMEPLVGECEEAPDDVCLGALGVPVLEGDPDVPNVAGGDVRHGR